jgi:hypothetical protein
VTKVSLSAILLLYQQNTTMNNLSLESINVRRSEGGLYSVFDAIQFIAQKNNQRKVWERLVESHSDIVTNVTMSKPIGVRQKPTPMASKSIIIEIILLLPGNVGGAARKAASELLLKYLDAPEELAKEAISRIANVDKLKDVLEVAHRKYITTYHPVMGEIKKRDGLTPTTYQHTNSLNTRACMGAEPSVIKAERGGKTAREHATAEELSRLAVLQEMQYCGLKKVDAKGHSEISAVVQSAADKFQAMLQEFGVV